MEEREREEGREKEREGEAKGEGEGEEERKGEDGKIVTHMLGVSRMNVTACKNAPSSVGMTTRNKPWTGNYKSSTLDKAVRICTQQ